MNYQLLTKCKYLSMNYANKSKYKNSLKAIGTRRKQCRFRAFCAQGQISQKRDRTNNEQSKQKEKCDAPNKCKITNRTILMQVSLSTNPCRYEVTPIHTP